MESRADTQRDNTNLLVEQVSKIQDAYKELRVENDVNGKTLDEVFYAVFPDKVEEEEEVELDDIPTCKAMDDSVARYNDRSAFANPAAQDSYVNMMNSLQMHGLADQILKLRSVGAYDDLEPKLVTEEEECQAKKNSSSTKDKKKKKRKKKSKKN